MEPVSLTVGMIAAALVAEATDRATTSAVDTTAAAARGFVSWLRHRVGWNSPPEASTALARVEDAPDSPSRLQELAEVLDRWAEADTEFRLGAGGRGSQGAGPRDRYRAHHPVGVG